MQRVAIAPRPDWKATAEKHGFRFHTIDGEVYWDESAYYAFTLEQIERDIERPTGELHAMALDLAGEIVRSEEKLSKLAIPPKYWDWIADSWSRGQPHLYGRWDLAYDGRGPAKALEANYDTPTSVYEAAFFQWQWLEEQVQRGVIARGTDQFNSLHENLVFAFATIAKGLPRPFYFSAVRDSEEDQATVAYLCDCAAQAGIQAGLLPVEDIGISTTGTFTDLQNIVIGTLFKLYPWEFAFNEEFGEFLTTAGTLFIEPPWKAILSHKGLLPMLWERYPGHPNLLPAYFDDPSFPLSPGWVRKPFFSREGANILICRPDGTELASDGPYTDCPVIRQAYHPLPQFDGGYPLIGSWVVGDRASGIGIREDAGPITQNTSRFVPHVIVPS
jgi:glutathionylspermidine synthase